MKSMRAACATRGVSTPQTQPIPGREPEMVKNNAGGYGFALDDFARLDRFLVLGTEGGTYYVKADKLTRENAQGVIRCLDTDGLRTVARIVEVSTRGLAPKADPAIFALAMAASYGAGVGTPADAAHAALVRAHALGAVGAVCRTGTHLFHFAEAVEGFRGWGRGLRRAFAEWYTDTPLDKLALQAVKYRQRDGWSHRDLLRLAHPLAAADDTARRALFAFMAGKEGVDVDSLPWIVRGFLAAQGYNADPAALAQVIREYRLPREALPTEALNAPEVWAALLDDMPLGAVIRNLGKMSAVGLLKPFSPAAEKVCHMLRSPADLAKARIHPVGVLLAARTYGAGHGERGSNTWAVNGDVVAALDDAFTASFATAVPTGKRIVLGVDVSGSMQAPCVGAPLRAWQAGAAVALSFAKIEPHTHTVAFDTACKAVGLNANDNLAAAEARFKAVGGGTDLSQPVRYAMDRGIACDAFVIVTDSETWAGKGHTAQVIEEYRRRLNPAAKLVVLATAANHANVVDPTDALAMGACGFDASVLDVVTGFLRA